MPLKRQVILRLLVGGLVAVTIAKLVLQPSPGTEAKETEIKVPIFWKRNHQHLEIQNHVHPQDDMSTVVVAEAGPVQKVDLTQPDPQKSPLRIVHFDLKGAAPKLSYMEQIFPLLSSLGADGVLLEYEDMFPYEGDLKLLRSPHAYSFEDIKTIRALAKKNKLELIPLVQIFGHLEFVLKHEKYTALREVAAFPNSLNPQAPGAHALVTDMVMQVLNQHPEAQWFHIGADEVYGLGDSQDSKNWLHANNGNIGKLFLNHVTAVGVSVLEKRQNINLLMWDDMIRTVSIADLEESGLPRVASPVIWEYNPNFDTGRLESFVLKYQEAGFKSVWFASAFKGASGVAQQWTPLEHHLRNHLSWLKVMEAMHKYPSMSLQGIMLTGWQRYDHYMVLCELLPAGIPSLAICLQTLKHGDFNEKVKDGVQHILGCNVTMEKSLCEGSGAFPGSELYHMVHHIHTNLENDIRNLMNNHYLKGSFSRYHRKYNFANPRNLELFKGAMYESLKKWETYLENFHTQMENVYFSDTVEEWIDENVNNSMDQLRSLVADLDKVITLNGKPKSISKQLNS